MKKIYTEKEINDTKGIYKDYMCINYEDVMSGSSVYASRETNENNEVISFYIGIKDASGRAITGYDQSYGER